MARYQLFRTSPSLTGQVRLDILINKCEENIIGNDIYVVPINDSIDYNESNKRDTLRYSHLDNIKNLYREIGGDFYNTDGEYTIKSWLYDGEVREDPYSHIYMAGPRRMRYTRYGKQFAYMVPIWISEYTDFNKLEFVCHMRSEDRDVITSKIVLSEDIIRYLQDYMDNSATGVCISDNLVNIDFEHVDSYIQGVQADTGQYMTRDTSYIMNLLLKRERPMIETDSNILDLFRQNNMIAQQILNLNLIFNVEDVSGAWPEYYLYNKNINIWIDVLYDGKSLDYKDLYTNYQFIPKYNIKEGSYTSENVLDFMEDYNCIDTIYDNKFTQPIFHWAPVNNPDYMFNIYSGCAPSLEDDMILQGGSFGWVDVSLDSADPWKQNWKWLKFKDFTGYVDNNWKSDYDDCVSDGHPEKLYTKIIFNQGSLAIGGNIFNKSYDDEDASDWSGAIDLISGYDIWMALVLDEQQAQKYEFILNDNNGIYIIIKCKSVDDMLLYNMCHSQLVDYQGNMMPEIYRDFLLSDIQSDIVLLLLKYIIGYDGGSGKNLWNRWIRPNVIEFDDTLSIFEENKTLLDQSTKEFRFVETEDSYYSYMYRYAGNLIPLFINPDDKIFRNYFYRYYQWDNKRSNVMKNCSTLKNKNIAMVYPSIEIGEDRTGKITYFPWIRDGESYVAPFYDDWNIDMIWGRINKLWNLPPTVIFEKTIDRNLSPSEIETEIWNGFIQALYDMYSSQDCPLADTIIEHETEFRNYINRNYEIIQNFEYASLPESEDRPGDNHDDINHIIYTITYKLR